MDDLLFQRGRNHAVTSLESGYGIPRVKAEVTMNHLRNNPRTAKKLSDCTKCLDEQKILELHQ